MGKNLKISQYNFNNNAVDGQLLVEGFYSLEIQITKQNDDFIITRVWADMLDEYNNKMKLRYSDKQIPQPLDKIDKRLADIQYAFRKAYQKRDSDAMPVKKPVTLEDAFDVPPPTEPTPEPLEVKIAPPEPKKLGLDALIFDSVTEAIESKGTKQSVHKIINSFLTENGIVPNQTHVIVTDKNQVKRNVGTQHKLFPKILKVIEAGVNLALVGEAGSGKTTAVANVADALGLPFYSKSVSAQTGVYEFFGYKDANGKTVRTLFQDAYENGGVFLLDEFDAGNPNVLASMNQAISNECVAFADGMIQKHKDFVIVMAGNTFGNGATMDYVGRQKIDKATLDRFCFMEFGYDEDFELQLATNIEWAKKVQKFRKLAQKKKVRAIISPRATFEGEKLLSVGLSESDVIDMLILKGLSQDERNLLTL